MKVWYGFGSEHSANLVMIGKFKDSQDASDAMRMIDEITEQVNADVDVGQIEVGELTEHYTETMLGLMRRLNIYVISPNELEQFAYDVRVNVDNDEIIVRTDESDVSAFLKLMIQKGARVQVYSAHDYPESERGRG
jgi:maltodextrin utilization protein YvdJ